MDKWADLAGEEPSFRVLADALGLGMPFQILVPPDGQGRTFVSVGESCREMTGVEPAEAMADATRLYGRILPEDLEALAAAEAQALAQSKTFDMEVRMLGANGDVRWRRILSTPRRRTDGSTLWDGLLSDVTEQRHAEAELQEQRRRLQSAVDATGLGLWEWDPRGGSLNWTDRNRELFGLESGEPVSIQRYMDELVHPDDRDAIAASYQAAADKPEGGHFLIEHRTRVEPDGKPRWLQARGRVVKDAEGVRLVVGATLDISERKAAEERRALLMGELAHRAKNGILVMMAIVAQTARGVQTVEDFETVLTARLKAMADSQDLVTASGGRPVQLADVVATTLTPFDASRFDVDEGLAEVTVAGEVAVALGLLLHELSTNAVKYGALSKPSGRVVIRRDGGDAGETVLKWTERGGPEVTIGKRKGFGSRLLDVALRPQGGKVEAAFDPKGFRADIAFPNAPVAQQAPKP